MDKWIEDAYKKEAEKEAQLTRIGAALERLALAIETSNTLKGEK